MIGGPAGAGGGIGGGGMQVHYQPTIVANDQTLRTLLSGGGNAFIDHIRQNKSAVNAALRS
jgi:hypothetical protein